MADTMYLLVQWEDRFMSVIKQTDVVSESPKNRSWCEGDLITANFEKKPYEAVICEIHPNKKYLLAQAKLPPKFTYHEAKRNSKVDDEESPTAKPNTVSQQVARVDDKESMPEKNGQHQPEKSRPDTFCQQANKGDDQKQIRIDTFCQPATVVPPTTISKKAETVDPPRATKETGWEEECSRLRRKIRKLEEKGGSM